MAQHGPVGVGADGEALDRKVTTYSVANAGPRRMNLESSFSPHFPKTAEIRLAWEPEEVDVRASPSSSVADMDGDEAAEGLYQGRGDGSARAIDHAARFCRVALFSLFAFASNVV
jgi:hypothetical protein